MRNPVPESQTSPSTFQAPVKNIFKWILVSISKENISFQSCFSTATIPPKSPWKQMLTPQSHPFTTYVHSQFRILARQSCYDDVAARSLLLGFRISFRNEQMSTEKYSENRVVLRNKIYTILNIWLWALLTNLEIIVLKFDIWFGDVTGRIMSR